MIFCPTCGEETGVLETRASGGYSRRRRICKSATCGTKVTTIESIVAGRDYVLIKRRKLNELQAIVASICSQPPIQVEE